MKKLVLVVSVLVAVVVSLVSEVAAYQFVSGTVKWSKSFLLDIYRMSYEGLQQALDYGMEGTVCFYEDLDEALACGAIVEASDTEYCDANKCVETSVYRPYRARHNCLIADTVLVAAGPVYTSLGRTHMVWSDWRETYFYPNFVADDLSIMGHALEAEGVYLLAPTAQISNEQADLNSVEDLFKLSDPTYYSIDSGHDRTLEILDENTYLASLVLPVGQFRLQPGMTLVEGACLSGDYLVPISRDMIGPVTLQLTGDFVPTTPCVLRVYWPIVTHALIPFTSSERGEFGLASYLSDSEVELVYEIGRRFAATVERASGGVVSVDITYQLIEEDYDPTAVTYWSDSNQLTPCGAVNDYLDEIYAKNMEFSNEKPKDTPEGAAGNRVVYGKLPHSLLDEVGRAISAGQPYHLTMVTLGNLPRNLGWYGYNARSNLCCLNVNDRYGFYDENVVKYIEEIAVHEFVHALHQIFAGFIPDAHDHAKYGYVRQPGKVYGPHLGFMKFLCDVLGGHVKQPSGSFIGMTSHMWYVLVNASSYYTMTVQVSELEDVPYDWRQSHLVTEWDPFLDLEWNGSFDDNWSGCTTVAGHRLAFFVLPFVFLRKRGKTN